MDTTEYDRTETLITLTSDIVAAHVSNNSVSAEEVASLITNVYSALSGLGQAVTKKLPRKNLRFRSVRRSSRIISSASRTARR